MLQSSDKPQIVNILTPAFRKTRLSARQNQPFVSVVVTTSARGRLLLDRIQALLGLDYPSFELIIVDRGRDNGGRVVLSSLLACANINYYHLPEAEIVDAYSFGSRYARASLVAFKNDEECLEQDFLNNSVQIFRETPQIALLFRTSDSAAEPTGVADDIANLVMARRVHLVKMLSPGWSGDPTIVYGKNGMPQVAARMLQHGFEAIELVQSRRSSRQSKTSRFFPQFRLANSQLA